MTNTELIEKKDLREQLIGRIEVLDKVKKLFLIPEMEVMTTKMVADYFEVDVSVIKMCYNRNKQEISLDGVLKKKLSDFYEGNEKLHSFVKTKYNISFKCDEYTVVIPNCGTLCFSKRAILRVAMLLRDSKIAQEIRTQLLNTFEYSPRTLVTLVMS